MQSVVHRRRFASIAIIGGLLLGLMSAGAASAVEDTVTGHYKGSTFDMSEGWGKAQSCVVVSRSEAQCFDSNASADALALSMTAERLDTTVEALKKLETQSVALAAAPACANNWFCIYSGTYGSGRRLIFQDDYWQRLDAYGFDNQASSARNRQGSGDRGGLAQHWPAGGTINWYSGIANTLGSLNNRASAVQG